MQAFASLLTGELVTVPHQSPCVSQHVGLRSSILRLDRVILMEIVLIQYKAELNVIASGQRFSNFVHPEQQGTSQASADRHRVNLLIRAVFP